METIKVKRTERGWAGHFICADRCLFRRNTLLEGEDPLVKVVISTVGLMKDIHNLKEQKFETIGCNRYYETMVFLADLNDTRYYDMDVSKEVKFESPWSISKIDADDKANEMHEQVVKEITFKIKNNELKTLEEFYGHNKDS